MATARGADILVTLRHAVYGSALAVRGDRGGFTESCRLVLDLSTFAAQHSHVLTPMVGAEQQLPTHGQGRADVGLSTAPVTPVQGRQRLDGGESSSHVSPFGSPHDVGTLASVTWDNI